MVKLSNLFSNQKRLWQQDHELAQLRDEVNKLRAQNDSMRQGMRRCVTCEYRIDFKQRQDDRLVVDRSPDPLDTNTEHST
jgi:cell division protein FtsB